MGIRFGCCCSGAKSVAVIKAAGYDYFEFNFTVLSAMSEQEFGELEQTVRQLGFYGETFNCFFPGNIALVGPNIDLDAVRAHAHKALERAVRLGGKVAVIGSGKARSVPEGYDADLAAEQFCTVVRLCADIAVQYGLKVAVEPLNVRETNFINTVEDCVALCRRLDHPNVGVLVDFFHTYVNGEPVDAVLAAKDLLTHVHYCSPDRGMPDEKDADITRQWAQALRACGYDGRISLEGVYKPDFEADIRGAREMCRMFE